MAAYQDPVSDTTGAPAGRPRNRPGQAGAGHTCQLADDVERALVLFESAVRYEENRLGAAHPDVHGLRLVISEVLVATGRIEDGPGVSDGHRPNGGPGPGAGPCHHTAAERTAQRAGRDPPRGTPLVLNSPAKASGRLPSKVAGRGYHVIICPRIASAARWVPSPSL